jgi:hypothetical protein
VFELLAFSTNDKKLLGYLSHMVPRIIFTGNTSFKLHETNKQISKIILLPFTSVGFRVESKEEVQTHNHTHTHASTYVVTYTHTKPTQII